MNGGEKKFKVKYFEVGDNTHEHIEGHVNLVINEEYENGYEPLSVSIDPDMCMILFKKIEKTSAKKNSKSRYESVRRLIEK